MVYYRFSLLLMPWQDMKTNEALPSEIVSQLKRIGSGIKTARMRRRMTQEDLAERVGTSWHTIRKIEGGSPVTRIGYYLNALWVLGLFGDVRLLADPERDREGIILEAAARGTRARPHRTLNRDF